MSPSERKRREGEDEGREEEEGGDQNPLWDRWTEWVHREKSKDDYLQEIEPPNAEIDLNRIKGWIQECRTHHGESCNDRYSDALAQHCGDLVLVDTIDGCIVNLPNSTTYIALSYVWGSTPMPKLRQSNYDLLKQPGKLFGQRIDGIRVPQVIQDAMYLVRNLHERYLWVDSLCVMQDASAEDMKKILQAMARIYASAEFTIVAAGGSDADHGLRGIGGPSQSRTPDGVMYHPFDLEYRTGFPVGSVWASRGWTFQESIFARRLLIFGTLTSWICGRCEWQEELRDNFPRPETWPRDRRHEYYHMGIMATITPYPSLRRWANLVEEYTTSRALTHENDFVRAFAGATNVIGPTFPGGFLHGLPKFFLDIALLWEPWSEISRRHEGPSWSWTGWKGEVACSRAWDIFDPSLYGATYEWTSWVPIASLKSVAIYQEENSSTKLVDSSIHNGFYEYQSLRYLLDEKLPDGWKRIEQPEGAYFTYPDTRGDLFRCGYPIPLALGIDGNKSASAPSSYLICTSPIATLSRGDVPGNSERRKLGVALLLQDVVVGQLLVHCEQDMCQAREDSSCELVAISEAKVQKEDRYIFGCHPAHNKPRGYSYYNVLWIHWENGIAYRKGVGAVDKDTWDSLRAEVRTFKLG
jgi:hypothetical protein